MLANLLRGSSGQKGNQYPDSVTDDAHTRNLLFGNSEHIYNLTTSPPASPFGSPALRPSSFDDHGGVELEEKDVRVLLAQDAYLGSAGPTLLFDSRQSSSTGASTTKPQPVTRSQLPTTWRNTQDSADKLEETFRSRSSTFSGTQTSWGKPVKDMPKEDTWLECMFGAPSSTKTASSTKMHIISAKSRPINVSERLPKKASENVESRRKAPLTRAHTSGQPPTLSTLEENHRDMLLVTRLFHVTLEDNAKVVSPQSDSRNNDYNTALGGGSLPKPPKLVELKVPTFAIGIAINLPYLSQRPRSSQSRAAFNSAAGLSLTSATSSFGSDMQSSWTFLDALPTSLSSSMTFSDDGDRGIDIVIANWDVILRSISSFESVAAAIVNEQLANILAHMTEPQNKPPKEKSMQRINQRIVAIHAADAINRRSSLASAANDVSRRIVYAIRIPRVVTGQGVVAGHWIDEARTLYRICGGRQQNFFLLNLLTAFLGNHMQWLELLAPEWYRQRFQANHKRPDEPRVLASRTIIVSENKGLARRLIYILASFLPGRMGIDGLQKPGDEVAIASSSSPSANLSRGQFARRSSKPSIRNAQAMSENSKQILSSSASSHKSQASTFIDRSPRKSFVRKDSNKFLVTKDAILSTIDSDGKFSGKEASGTVAAVAPNAATIPMAFISSRRDVYFPESPLVDTNDSVASADLAKVLHKASFGHRRTSSVSSRWGSLVSGISEIWSNKQSTPGDRSSIATSSHGGSPAEQHKRTSSSALAISRGNTLQNMVDELDQGYGMPQKDTAKQSVQNATSPGQQSLRAFSTAPRLHVDSKDGVVDVELDLPGFLTASGLTPPQHQQSKPRSKTTSFNRDYLDSICSLRSVPTRPAVTSEDYQVNVGGYLKRHHEDFVLHAVRPYTELLGEIKRAMRAEPTPQEIKDLFIQQDSSPTWMPVCTTLVADTKPFSIHRLTLRRQFELQQPTHIGSLINESSEIPIAIVVNEEITDEVVMEFDTTLADAVEKALNVGMVDPARRSATSRTHSRNVSVGSVRATNTSSGLTQTNVAPTSETAESGKPDHRNPVVGALEDVVRSVNNDLNKVDQQGEPDSSRMSKVKPIQQENALREGVKNWMISVEQISSSVW